ncbi:hypothetical protein GCM10008940_02310 [Microbulbifer agarilyticus]
MSSAANAYTECPATPINKIYVGDDGNLYIFLENSGSFLIPPEDPSQKNVLSLALSAYISGKKVKVRYESENIACDGNLINDFRGIWLVNP